MTADNIEDIYKDDRLKRDIFCKNLSTFIKSNGNRDNGLTIALNGGFGSGKTTFLRLLEKELLHNEEEKENSEKEKRTVIYYDCWKNSVFDEPLLPIIGAISEKLNTSKKSWKEKGLDLVKYLCKFGKNVVGGIIGVEIPGIDKNEDLFEQMKSYNALIDSFKKDLGEIAKKEKIIILFDEMDRCLPTYAIQILEKINHLFNISGITSLIAVDNNQLEKTIETIFGGNTNVRGYLTKFIDYEFELPKSMEQEKILLMDMFVSKEYAESTLSIVNSFDFELREKIKLIEFFNKYALTQHPITPSSVEIIVLTIVKCVKLKHGKLFDEIFKDSATSSSSRKMLKIADTKTERLLDFMTDRRMDIVHGNNYAWMKQTFLLVFDEVGCVDITELRKYFDMDESSFNTTINVHNSPINVYRPMLKNILKFVNELS